MYFTIPNVNIWPLTHSEWTNQKAFAEIVKPGVRQIRQVIDDRRFEWAKFMAMKLLLISISRAFAANWLLTGF